MHFLKPEAFVFLWMIPAIVLVFLMARNLRKKKLSQLGYLKTLQDKLMPHYRPGEVPMRALLLMLVCLFATFALARPQWGEEKREIKRKGVDLIFLLDTSLSMLAEDSKPSRFEKSKIEIKSIVRRLKGDRVGMIAFAGSSFLQSPLTLDYSAFFLFLDAIRVGYIPDPGTSLDKAVRLAAGSFPDQDMKHRAVILFSDGEDHQGGIEEAVKLAEESGVRIYTLGVGKPEGEPIPLKDENGRATGYKKDRANQVVMTRLNAANLEIISQGTGGLYFPSTPGEQEVDLILKHLGTLGQKSFKERLITEKEDHFQIFLILALALLLIEAFIRRTDKAPTQTAQAMVVLLSFFLMTGFIQTTGGLNKKGNELYEEKKFQSAIDQYRKAQVKSPDDATVRYNLAATLYQTEDYQEAAKHLEHALKHSEDETLKAKAYYNQGNAQYRLGQFEKAIDSYKKALELDSDDQDAKYNLELLQEAKNRFQKKDQEDKKESKDQQEPEHQDKQENQEQEKKNQQNQQQEQDEQEQQDQQQQDQEQEQEQEQRGQDEQDEQEQQQDQQDQQKSDQGDQERQDEQDQQNQKNEQQQEQEQQQQQNQQQPEPEPQPARPEPDPQSQQQDLQERNMQRQPLQGQMSKQNALRILDALMGAEKELQDLRRPPANPEMPYVEKDW